MAETTRLSTRRFPLYRAPLFFVSAIFSRAFRSRLSSADVVRLTRTFLVPVARPGASSPSSSSSPLLRCSLGLQYRNRARLLPRSRRTAEGG